MLFKKSNRLARISIGKVQKMIEQGLSIFASHSFEIDKEYLDLFRKQYRIYVYPFVKLVDHQRLRITLSYEYFMADDFLLSIEVFDQENKSIGKENFPEEIKQLRADYVKRIEEAKNTYEKVNIAFLVLGTYFDANSSLNQ